MRSYAARRASVPSQGRFAQFGEGVGVGVVFGAFQLGIHRHHGHNELLEQDGTERDRLRLDRRLVARVHRFAVGFGGDARTVLGGEREGPLDATESRRLAVILRPLGDGQVAVLRRYRDAVIDEDRRHFVHRRVDAPEVVPRAAHVGLAGFADADLADVAHRAD